MREFDQIKDMVYEEIEEISRRGQLNKEAICVVGELVDILKDIGTVEMFEEGIYVPENEYSLASGYNRNGGYSQRYYNGNSYNNGDNYRSNRNYNSGYQRSRYGYSREDGKDHMIEKLHHLMNEANDEQDKMSIQKLINQMENN